MTLTYFELGDIRVAQEHQGDPDGGVVIGIGDLVRELSVADAMELAQALLDQMQPALPDQVICAPPKGCGAAVIWLKTTAGRPTPVDPKKVVVCSADGSYHTGYESHFASCPNRARFRQTCPGCKTITLEFDLYDEKPILCPHCKLLVSHPAMGGYHPGIEMLRSFDRGDQAINELHSKMMRGRRPGHDFIGIEQMSTEELSTATVAIVKECFKRMKLPDDNWPLRLNSILELLGIGNVVLPEGTKERDAQLRKLLGYD